MIFNGERSANDGGAARRSKNKECGLTGFEGGNLATILLGYLRKGSILPSVQQGRQGIFTLEGSPNLQGKEKAVLSPS